MAAQPGFFDGEDRNAPVSGLEGFIGFQSRIVALGSDAEMAHSDVHPDGWAMSS
jgi:hypothetical protein